jgi:two-component system, sensor histidine kinase
MGEDQDIISRSSLGDNRGNARNGDLAARIADLGRRIAELQKNNRALINQTERDADRLCALEGKIRSLSTAKKEAEGAKAQLTEAIEALPEGFALFDAEDRLVLFNDGLRSLCPDLTDLITPGRTYAEILRAAVERHVFAMPRREQRRWIQGCLSRHRKHDGPIVQALADGRWIRCSERSTAGGGTACTYTDVTEIKQRQAAKDLEQAKRQLDRRVAERTAELTELNERLRIAKAMADTANLSKTKFLAAASHDLLQPLNAARLFVSALLDSEVPAELARLIKGVDTALQSVDELLSTLLEIAKLDTGVVKPERSDFPVCALLEALAFEFAVVAQKKKKIELRVVPCSAAIHSDMVLLRRILQNFVSNAIRYTSRGKVLIGCRHGSEGLRIEVWDTGPGIPEDRQQAVFEEFQRFAQPESGRASGVGLGLAIAQRSARLLGHRLQVRSVIGKGSVFAVHVPYGRTAKPLSTDLTPAANPSYGLGEATIVFIENDEENLEGMTALLTRWSCRVLQAHTVSEALDRIDSERIHPDLVIADYHLNDGGTGLDAIVSVRRHCNLPIPGIIITADHAAAVQDVTHKAGYEILQKPIKPAELRSLMSHMLT